MGLDVVPIIKALAPPSRGHGEAHEIELQSWRWNVAYFCLSLGAVVAVHIAWGGGLFPWVSGFAASTDVARLDARAKNIEVRIISQDLYEARREQCRAMHDNDAAAKPGPLRRHDALIADYESMTGLSYRMPDCDEF